MKIFSLALATVLSMTTSSYVFADSYDTEPSSGVVSGTDAINDNGNSNGLVQGSGTIQDQDTNNNPPLSTDSSTSGMSRDGETMGDEN